MKYDIPQNVNDLINEAIEIYGFDIEPTDEEIWDIVKFNEEFPHFDNIFMYTFFVKLEQKLPKDLKYQYTVNGYDSHLYYVDENDNFCEITSLKKLIKMIKENK